jgi:hypothetical protein
VQVYYNLDRFYLRKKLYFYVLVKYASFQDKRDKNRQTPDPSLGLSETLQRPLFEELMRPSVCFA